MLRKIEKPVLVQKIVVKQWQIVTMVNIMIFSRSHKEAKTNRTCLGFETGKKSFYKIMERVKQGGRWSCVVFLCKKYGLLLKDCKKQKCFSWAKKNCQSKKIRI